MSQYLGSTIDKEPRSAQKYNHKNKIALKLWLNFGMLQGGLVYSSCEESFMKATPHVVWTVMLEDGWVVFFQ